MPATIDVARDEMNGAFKVAWDAGTTAVVGYVPEVAWDGEPERTDRPHDLAWARVIVRHAQGFESALTGATGLRIYEREGIIAVQIFAPLEVGGALQVAEELAKVAKGAFEGQRTSSGVWFRDVTPAEVGETEAWYQFNVTATFNYDEKV